MTTARDERGRGQSVSAASGPASPSREAIVGQSAAAQPKAVASQASTDAPRRRKDEPSPPSVWGILRPGKAGITAPDGAAWLKWWTTLAGKAVAEGKLDDLQILYEANVMAWDEIALGSAEAHDVVAEAGQIVRAALGD